MSSHRRFCAFCRSSRAVYTKQHVGFADAGLAASAAGLLSWVLWQDFDPRALVLFALGLGLAEIFILLRWRLSISCSRCGFDPVLYRKSPEKAADRVKTFMRERREDPFSAFQAMPKLPVLRKAPAETASQLPSPPRAETQSKARPKPPAGATR